MIVRFVVLDLDPVISVDYNFDTRAPCVGEVIYSQGDDPEFPRGEYRVSAVTWVVGLRGPERAICRLDPILNESY